VTLKDVLPLVVLTGAGISAESGVPTFRGAQGLWRNHRAQDLATPQAFSRDPELVWAFYGWRRELVASCKPNAAHRVLASLQKELRNLTLITQNVDGLHQAAGSQDPLELHGSLWRLRCTTCGHRWEDHRVPLPNPIPECPSCESTARPDVVWFGESLDPVVVEAAFSAAESARTMLVVGTSALVSPASELPRVAQAAGARLVEINPESTPISPICDVVLRGPATTMLGQWAERNLGWQEPS
jgi:NAD-dependent deacetylase